MGEWVRGWGISINSAPFMMALMVLIWMMALIWALTHVVKFHTR
jgi:hypothetical protein